MRAVRCANSPGAWERLTDLDRAFVTWFRSLLEWQAADPASRGPEPAEPLRTDYDRDGGRRPAGDTR